MKKFFKNYTINDVQNVTEIIKEIEIWNKDKWEEYNSEENISADDIAENMTMLGI